MRMSTIWDDHVKKRRGTEMMTCGKAKTSLGVMTFKANGANICFTHTCQMSQFFYQEEVQKVYGQLVIVILESKDEVK